MQEATWAQILASALIAQGFLLVIELVRGQLERDQRRKDRREDAERDAIYELQDALAVMASASTALALHREDIYEETGEWRFDMPYTDSDSLAYFTAHARAGILLERIDDQTVRDRVQDVRTALDAYIALTEPDHDQTKWKPLQDIFTAAMQATGHRLRKL